MYNSKQWSAMETSDKVLLEIILDHLVVTERLVEHYVRLAHAVQQQPRIAANFPAVEQPLGLQELRTETQILIRRIHAILERE